MQSFKKAGIPIFEIPCPMVKEKFMGKVPSKCNLKNQSRSL